MGKQTAVALTEIDEDAFLTFLRSIADVRLLVSAAPTVDDLWIDSFRTAGECEWQFYIWNTAFPWEPTYGTVTRDASGLRNGWKFIGEKGAAPLIEYLRHRFDNPKAVYGRIYWGKSFSAANGLAYDVAAFERWYAQTQKDARGSSARRSAA